MTVFTRARTVDKTKKKKRKPTGDVHMYLPSYLFEEQFSLMFTIYYAYCVNLFIFFSYTYYICLSPCQVPEHNTTTPSDSDVSDGGNVLYRISD